ncbi:tRNA1(Val) (adenine(37)-N6)-methyltransferase [Lunatibacter salilacus]|uniref:tRNA1(Val) (adenine(37)-N6)-methyltransferase n=1 Tax=Lunatibacter salilacus TaxID=2483804 RepID=UPI00131E34AE|nr:methyltransferase [Lunatibacter salilacus]
MGNSYFQFKQFRIEQGNSAMKVSTDAVVLGASSGSMAHNTILDIGTGTGVIALMLAQRYPEAEIFALEIDRKACVQAAENIRNSPWVNQVTVIDSSLQEYQNRGVRFDLIVSNPPYYPNHLLSEDFRRNQALHQGTLTFLELLVGVDKLLEEDGELWVILPERQMCEFELIAKNEGFVVFKRITIKDSRQKPVLRVIQAFGKSKRTEKTFEANELVIKDNDGEFSAAYRNLLKDYMLHF